MTAKQLIEECKKRTTLKECRECPYKYPQCWKLLLIINDATPSSYEKIFNSEEHL